MRTVAVIPAYNEAHTMGDVIDVVKQVSLVDEVIVISDGSTDRTADVARSCGATVIELEQNVGKGGAMKAGIDRADADIFLFLDADLVGLTQKHIEALLMPVLDQQVDMTLGVFEKGRLATDLALAVAPYLSGQRAVHSRVLKDVSGMDMARFGVEMALTRHIQEYNVVVEKVTLPGLTHRMKEEKLGLFQGFMARMKMYWEIVKYTGKSIAAESLRDPPPK